MEQIGRVKKVGLVYLYEKHEDGPGENPLFKDKIVITLSIAPNPDKAWPNDRHMQEYDQRINRVLIRVGILSFEAREALGHLWERHIDIATEFPTLNAAQKLFNMATDADIVDIYLYRNGKLVDKLD